MATVAKWWPEIRMLLATGFTTVKVEANTIIKNIKCTAHGFRNPANYQGRILLEKCRTDGNMSPSRRAGVHYEPRRAVLSFDE